MGRVKNFIKNKEDGTELVIPTPSYLTSEQVGEITTLLFRNKSAIDSEYASLLSTYMTQLMGHYNQLLIRCENVIKGEERDAFAAQIAKFEEEKTSISKLEAKSQISLYTNLMNNIKQSYSSMEDALTKSLDENKVISEIAKGIPLAYETIEILDKMIKDGDLTYDAKLQELKDLYKGLTGMTNEKEQLSSLMRFIDEGKRLLTMVDDVEKQKRAPAKTERVFDLFAKINDQIISHKFLKKDSFLYATYLLEDGSTYYAIIAPEDKVLEEERTFQNPASINMDQASVKQALEAVLSNAIAYYDLNEYTRYIEKSYKGQMTKEVDQALMQYKNRLSNMESIIKGQMQFLDDLAPIFNGKTSNKYPNVVYHDVAPSEFYPMELTGSNLIDEAVKEQRNLIVNVLASDKVKNSLTSKDLLLAIYGPSKVSELVNSKFAEEKKDLPGVVVDTKVSEVSKTPIVTNPEKVSNYLKIRKGELNTIKVGTTPTVFTVEEDSLYQDINTILNLNTAAAISDKQYKNGQGTFAIMRYLKTGEATAFTGENGARSLASSVKKEEYTALLMENIIKSFAGANKKSGEDPTYLDRMNQALSFAQRQLSAEGFSPNMMSNELLEDEGLLKLTIENFDYDYLDPLSESSRLFAQAIEEGVLKRNASAIKFKDAVSKIKNFAKQQNLDSSMVSSNVKAA